MTNIKNIRGAEPAGGQAKGPGEANTIIATTAIYGAGNVLSLDDSTAGQAVPYDEQGAGEDNIILGISTHGTKDQGTGDYNTGARVGYTREGVHDVCLADDNQVIAAGDRLMAETDSITYDGQASSKIGAVDLSAPTALTTTGDATTHGELATVFVEYSKIIGIALEAKAQNAGGYIKTLLCIPVLMVIPTA